MSHTKKGLDAPPSRWDTNLLLKAVAEAGEHGLNCAWFIYQSDWAAQKFYRIRGFLMAMFPDKFNWDKKTMILTLKDSELRVELSNALADVPSYKPSRLKKTLDVFLEQKAKDKDALVKELVDAQASLKEYDAEKNKEKKGET